MHGHWRSHHSLKLFFSFSLFRLTLLEGYMRLKLPDHRVELLSLQPGPKRMPRDEDSPADSAAWDFAPVQRIIKGTSAQFIDSKNRVGFIGPKYGRFGFSRFFVHLRSSYIDLRSHIGLESFCGH